MAFALHVIGYTLTVALMAPFILYFNFCIPMLTLAYSLALYTCVSLDQLIAEVKRSRSTLRRAKMTLRLIKHYYSIREMTNEADPLFSTLLYVIKTMTMLVLAFVIIAGNFIASMERDLVFYFGSDLFTESYFLPLAIYVSAAIKANDSVSNILSCAAWCEMREAERRARYWATRDHVISTRVELLIELAHLRMGQGPLTLAGEPLDGDFYYSACIELNDMINLIGDLSTKFDH